MPLNPPKCYTLLLQTHPMPCFTLIFGICPISQHLTAVRHLAAPRGLLKGTSAVVKEEESVAHSLPPLRREGGRDDCICPLILTLVWHWAAPKLVLAGGPLDKCLAYWWRHGTNTHIHTYTRTYLSDNLKRCNWGWSVKRGVEMSVIICNPLWPSEERVYVRETVCCCFSVHRLLLSLSLYNSIVKRWERWGGSWPHHP